MSELEQLLFGTSGHGYPPYDIMVRDDGTCVIRLAVAGFSMNDLSIYLEDGSLVISGKKEKQEEAVRYIERGIGSRHFLRKFKIKQNLEVLNASLEDGILEIVIVRSEIDNKKYVPITSKTKEQLLTE